MANPTDKRFHQLTLAVQKATNSVETPVKEKHVRSTIIGTFQEQSAVTYWMVALRLPLQENRIVAWKFCHMTHKLLREGHPACLDDSQRHIPMLENLGKLWVHLREGYGRLIHLYTNLLVTKLKFHARNPRFPGNMQLTADELDAIAENDVNNYFQLCVELFDYMDDILNLQQAVFDSLGNARGNSMTAIGQCRLAALIPCAQDSSHMYDCNVRILFRLHAALPADTLAGHRDRFHQQFKKLSSFYKRASSLQYYRNLLTLPVLPTNPPNFLLQSDFGTYVTPVVSIPEPSPEEVDPVGSLIDTSDTVSQATTPEQLDMVDSRMTPSPQQDPIVERDRLIEHLQNELKRMRNEISQLVQERNSMLGSMREHCERLEIQLQTAKTELVEEKKRAEELSAETPEIKQKLSTVEEKAKVTDEKFQKLKGAYTQLREEHIALIRQKAEVDKRAAALRAAAAEQESAKSALQQQLNDRLKDVELLQQSASSTEEIDAYKKEITNLRSELEQSKQKELELQTLKASVEALEIEHKTVQTEQEEKLILAVNELKEIKDLLEQSKREKDEKEKELNKAQLEVKALREKAEEQCQVANTEKEMVLKEMTELKEKYLREKQELNNEIQNLQIELESVQKKTLHNVLQFTAKCSELSNKFTIQTNDLDNVLITKKLQLEETMEKLASFQGKLQKVKYAYETEVNFKNKEITDLLAKMNDLEVQNKICDSLVSDFKEEIETTKKKFSEAVDEIEKLNIIIAERDKEVHSHLEIIEKLKFAQTSDAVAFTEWKEKNEKSLVDVKNQLQEKDNEVNALRKIVEEKSNSCNMQLLETELLTNKIEELEKCKEFKSNEIEDLHSKLKESLSDLEKQKVAFHVLEKDRECEINILQSKLQSTENSKNELVDKLNDLIKEKDSEVITLSVQVNSLMNKVTSLEDVLNETEAQLEIGQDELITLQKEYQGLKHTNESNLMLKNQELRNLKSIVDNISKENVTLISDKNKMHTEFMLEKQVFEQKNIEMEAKIEKLIFDQQCEMEEKDKLIMELQTKLDQTLLEYENYKQSNNETIKSLNLKLIEHQNNFDIQSSQKDKIIENANKECDNVKMQFEELQKSNISKLKELHDLLSQKEENRKLLEAKLEHTQREKLSNECELQDLLQQNSMLEADVASMRKQLQESESELQRVRSHLVSCAGEASLAVTNEALTALETSNAQDSNRTAAAIAASALQGLAEHTEIKGNEEKMARSAILAAHNTAQLSAYVTEVSHLTTDMELSDKLNNQSRKMLESTKQFLESLKNGVLAGPVCMETKELIENVVQAAAAADSSGKGVRSVDDELADMDSAIEEAANQIEEMLAATRSGDTGVKLEVNGKILDACTALMAAVKVLVQDARKLQHELGDPKTRQKMYRKNPQWSQGLISAAKAVVFAAKLLVSSADEAVGAAGRVEGVSAAAHEVAGSTAQLVAASRARAPPSSEGLTKLTRASRSVAAATGAVVAAVRAAAALLTDTETLDTSTLTLTATRRLEMESKVRALELESALDAERARLAALRKRHYHLAQEEENGNMTNGKQ